MFDTVMQFDSGVSIPESVLLKASEKAIEAIKNELPEEAHLYEVFQFVFDKSKESLKGKRLIL